MRTFLDILADVIGESFEKIVGAFYWVRNGAPPKLIISPVHTSLRSGGEIASLLAQMPKR